MMLSYSRSARGLLSAGLFLMGCSSSAETPTNAGGGDTGSTSPTVAQTPGGGQSNGSNGSNGGGSASGPGNAAGPNGSAGPAGAREGQLSKMSTAEAQRLCTEASDVVNQVFSKDDKAMFSCTFVGILKTLQEQRADLLVGCQKHYTECLKAPPPFEPKRKPNCANFNEEKLAKCKEVTRDDVLQCVREGLTAWKGMTCEKALSSEDVRVPTCDRVDAACPGLFEDEGR